MATLFFSGSAPAVAQVATATFATYDATTTRTITIGGVPISRLDSGGDLTTALGLFATLLNGALVSGVAHPYFSTITWSSDATHIIGTASTAGVPFVFSGSVSGGTGTVSNAYTVSTASAGPSDWSTIGNWFLSTGPSAALPAIGDTIILSNNSVNIAYGLDQSAVTGVTLRSEQSYTGRVGLDYTVFATSVDGVTVASRPEYRTYELNLGATIWTHGDSGGLGNLTGSKRFLLRTGTQNCQATIVNTASTSDDNGRPAVRWRGVNALSVLNVRAAPGGFGVAAEQATDVATFLTLNCTDATGQARIVTGLGITATNLISSGGTHVFRWNVKPTTLTVSGGNVRTEGAAGIGTINCNGGVITSNNTGLIDLLNANAGTVSFIGSSNARSVTTINVVSGASVMYDNSALIITNEIAGKVTVTGN